MTPFITIVIPVRNEERFIAGTLQQILEQEYPMERLEVIIADGLSGDGTSEIVLKFSRNYPYFKLFDNPGRLPSSGRNVGFKNGRGDIFIVIDGHCYIPDKNLLRNVVRCFDKSGAYCLGRPQPLDPPGINVFQEAVSLARASKVGHSGNSFIYSNYEGYISPVSNGAIYKKEIFEKVGYVDENFDACEDVEFNYRIEKAGFKAYMSPSLVVKYYPRESLKGLFRQMKRYGMGRFKFINKHPEAINLNMLIPPIFVLGLLAFIAFGLCFSVSFLFHLSWLVSIDVAMGVLSLVYAVYVILVLGESLRIGLKQGLRFFKYLPPIFFTIHFGLGLGFLNEMLRVFFRRSKPASISLCQK
jgi:glycosyltransferase involved in cell wall biosynthesis